MEHFSPFADPGRQPSAGSYWERVFFQGTVSARETGAPASDLICLVLSGVLLFWSASLFASPEDHEVLGGFVAMVAVPTGILSIQSVRQWIRDEKKIIKISSREIREGSRRWEWQDVAAVRFLPYPFKQTNDRFIVVWTGRDRGPGSALVPDELIGPKEHEELVALIREFCENAGYSVRCE